MPAQAAKLTVKSNDDYGRYGGNLGRVVDIVDRETGEIIPSYISIDRKTNEITDIPASRVRIPERIGKTEITTQERDMLRAGLPVRDKLIERNDGRKLRSRR